MAKLESAATPIPMGGSITKLQRGFFSLIELLVSYREITLVFLLGLWGLTLLILTPPFQVPDEFAHFNRAYQVSEFTMKSQRQGNLWGGMLPQILKYDQTKFQFLPFHPDQKLFFLDYLKMRRESPSINPRDLGRREFYDFAGAAAYSPVPYIFSGLGIAVARFFSMTVLNGFYMARLWNLLAGLGLIYGAMRLLRRWPELQLMLFLVTGMPMVSFELMSISADGITFSLAVLVVACVVSLRSGWSRRVYVALLTSSILLGLCKPGYAFLPCISFVFWKSVPGSFSRKAGCILFASACALVPAVAWGKFVQASFVPNLKGVSINLAMQFQYFAEHLDILLPYFLKKIFFEDFVSHALELYGVLGWAGTPLSCEKAALYFCLCFSSVLILCQRRTLPCQPTNGNQDRSLFSLPARILLLAMALITTLLIALSLYLISNPVGVVALEGIQGRYFAPFLPIIFMSFYQLLPVRLTRSDYLLWAVFCLGVWGWLSWNAAGVLCARYWIL